MLNTPILFIVFNRPDTTQLVFNKIREQKPSKLYITSDGPRLNNETDKSNCEQVKAIVEKIDWPCVVKTLFRDENIGCAKGVSSAITWFFEQVEHGIILEDDCFPDLTFFSFCEQLLVKYNDEKEIGSICGFNNQLGIPRNRYSYYFARLHSSWGWATWADRWKNYNEISNKPELHILNNPAIFEWRQEIIDTFAGKIDSWAYRWQYVFRKNDFICIYPNISLIKNIGFTEDASNTKGVRWWYKLIRYGKIDTIIHPPERKICEAADQLTIQLNMALPLSWKDRLKRRWYACRYH